MKICIDAGHGGIDPGAISNGYIEKELNLIVARRVFTLLKEKGIDVTLIRQSDYTLNATDRTNLIKDNYEYCLSIHFNKFNGQAHGVETIHSIYGENGKKIADSIADSIADKIDVKLRRVFDREGSRGDYYYMHRLTGSTTTVIVEGMFIDNENDIDNLNIEKLSEGIAEGFLNFVKPIAKPKEVKPIKYYNIASTHIIELDPLDLKIANEFDKRGKDFDVDNFITASYIGHHKNESTYPTSILVSEGKVINDTQPNGLYSGPYKGKGTPTPTFIVFKDGTVDIRAMNNISDVKDVWFAVSGFGIKPYMTNGFEGLVNSICYSTYRVGMAYRKADNKVLLIYRPNTTCDRFKQTMDNLGCDFGITLDSGGSANFKVDGKFIKSTTRKIYAGITW